MGVGNISGSVRHVRQVAVGHVGEMKRYNLMVVIHASVAVDAASAGAAKLAIQRSCNLHLELVGMPDFVIQDAEVTGIYDIDWNEVEPGPGVRD